MAPVPKVGEHNAALLDELGYGEAEVATLRMIPAEGDRGDQ
jgi:crotonobetainyl-CoA:carnitine CoA-transferase CaiB-like acyl-CoA transferase